jgi:hypothetical protein
LRAGSILGALPILNALIARALEHLHLFSNTHIQGEIFESMTGNYSNS